MTHLDIKALDRTGRALPALAEGYDGKTHYAEVLMALVPAALILTSAVALIVVIL